MPDAEGVKVTVTRQVASGLTVPEAGQVLAGVSVKSVGLVPVIAMLLMLSATVALVSVSVELLAALVVPTVTVPKLNEDGSSVAVASAVVPVPLSASVCEPVLVLSKTVKVADRAPVAVGLNVTETVQVVSGLIVPELGQVVDELSLKSAALAPVIVMLLIFKATVALVSARVEDLAALVEPTARDPKESEEGKSVAVAVEPLPPVPDNATV